MIRNSPKAKLSRKFDNLVAQLAEERNHDLLAKALVHETPARDITFSDIIDQTMFFPVKELFSKFVDQTGLPALFQSPHKGASFINAYSEGYRRNPVKQRLFGIVDSAIRKEPAQMVEFLEQLHTIGDVGKAASLELLIQFSIRRDGNAKLIPLIKNPELLAMALK